ncbi:DUF1963 domain-containing protein [Gemmata sp.]|uniref:DUF1963 domain-containing protein n=1 Tax=Gemmata sp. TaxID=1914242 RepID=UPI003F724879
MPPERAPRSADERALLRALTGQLGDTLALDAYTDWLEEHDDPRGAYLRGFTTAYRSGRRLPARPQGVSADWDELVGLGPRRRLRDRPAVVGGLEPHLPTLLNAGQVCVRLDLLPRQSMSRVAPAASRAGGVPDLPVGTPWPMCNDDLCGGRWPMLFLGQINLADLADTLCQNLLPTAGLLSLFFYPENHPRGLELRYTPPGVPLACTRPPEPYAFNPAQIGNVRFPTDPTRPVRLVEAVRYPGWFDALAGTLGEFDAAGDDRIDWVLSGDRAEKPHYLASRYRPSVCSQWAPDLRFADVPSSHLELFELSDNEALHWHFGEKLHVFVDAAAARRGDFRQLNWGTI